MNNICIISNDDLSHISGDRHFERFVFEGKLLIFSEQKISKNLNLFSEKYDLVLLIQSNFNEKFAKNHDNIVNVFISEGNYAKSNDYDSNFLLIKDLKSLLPIFSKQFKSISLLFKKNHNDILCNLYRKKVNIKKMLMNKEGIFIFGAGLIGFQILKDCIDNNIKVNGFIDNSKVVSGSNLSEKVFKLSDINKHSVILISPGKSSSQIQKQLLKEGFQNIITLPEFFYSLNITSQPESGYYEDLRKYRIRYLELFLNLADQKSRKILSYIIEHRLTLDSMPLYQAYCKDVAQWFDSDIFSPHRDAVMVDGGAYDGDTISEFIAVNPMFKHVYGFEIDPNIACRAAAKFTASNKITILPYGLSDKKENKAFFPTNAMNGRIAESGSLIAKLISIDDIVVEPITFLKLDVEGSESCALDGAKKQISLNSPFMAIAVYHKPSDLWFLQKKIEKIVSKKYRYYLRHYTEVGYETVLYCV